MTAQGQLHAPAPHTCHTARTHTCSLSTNKTVYPERSPSLLMHMDMCVDLYVYTQIRFYIQDIKMSLWPGGVLGIWALCVRSNCNFASGGIAARQTDGMSYINIFMLEALLLSVGRAACVCCIDVRRSYLLTSKPGLCNCYGGLFPPWNTKMYISTLYLANGTLQLTIATLYLTLWFVSRLWLLFL